MLDNVICPKVDWGSKNNLMSSKNLLGSFMETFQVPLNQQSLESNAKPESIIWDS